ncbi:PspA/IM30 family protein [Chitiniphilus eburneus]|uniref:PspA/IM30 family protein n=1 Tax=Chitiniphilus eburneus TaxID=2571148 RepID=A0A4V6WI16_9NEIS|nr:PspA/IM30 family protein [Chitiniphilus eburneus]TJZ66668.1 PspA/IM30 family protein [Chitiniphilus eburneus]
MSIFSKILSALKGSAREIGESVVDANATRIYEQEIHESKAALARAKQDLTLVMAQEKAAQREIERLDKEILRFEEHAFAALDKAEENLAGDVATRIAELEAERDAQQRAQVDFAQHIASLKDLIRQAEARVREHERELAVAKTTESVYRATESISQSMGSGASKLGSARESLERIKERHTLMADRMKAAEELDAEFGNKALEQKLAAAGIGAEANRKEAVLARLKAQREADRTTGHEQ